MAPVEFAASMPSNATAMAVAAKNLNDNARDSFQYPYQSSQS